MKKLNEKIWANAYKIIRKMHTLFSNYLCVHVVASGTISGSLVAKQPLHKKKYNIIIFLSKNLHINVSFKNNQYIYTTEDEQQ